MGDLRKPPMRTLAGVLLVLLVAFQLTFPLLALQKAFQKDEPEWAIRIEEQHQALMDRIMSLSHQVDLETGATSQRLTGLEHRMADMDQRYVYLETGQKGGHPVQIAVLEAEQKEVRGLLGWILGGVGTIIGGGLLLAWKYFRRAAVIARQLSASHAELKEHLSEILNQTNGMSVQLQKIAYQAGHDAGHEAGRRSASEKSAKG